MSADRPRYACSECEYTGDKYALLDDGSTGGTAVCPACEEGLRLWVEG